MANSYFSQDLGGGYSRNPSTGEILNSNSGQVFPNEEALRQNAAVMSANPQQSGQSGGGGGAGGLAGGLGSAGTAYSLYNAGAGGQALAQTGGQALAQGGSQAVGTAANGGTMLANGTVQGGTQAAATGYSNAASTLGGGVGAGIAPYLGAAAFAYNQYNEAPKAYQQGAQYSMPQKAAWENYKDSWTENKSAGDWAKKAFDFFTFQDLLNGGYAGLGSAFGSKRKIDRDLRKAGRKSLKDSGIVDQDSSELYNLASGNQFNIRDFKNQTGGDAYNINWDDPTLDRDKVAFLDAISTARMGNKGKVGKASSDITGELFNAAKSDGNFADNVKFYGDRAGGRDALYGAIAERWEKDKSISADKRDAMFAAIDKEYGILNPTNSRWDAKLTGKDLERNQKEMAEAAKKKPEATPMSKIPSQRPNYTLEGRPAPVPAPMTAKPLVQINNTKNPYLKKK